MIHTYAPMEMHHDHGWLVVSDANEDVYIKIAKGLGTEKEQALARMIAIAPDLLNAATEFCLKVETGKAQSTKSYAAFKAAITKAMVTT